MFNYFKAKTIIMVFAVMWMILASVIVALAQQTTDYHDSVSETLKEENDIPFQVVFFKDVSTIKSTSIEVVSYVLNENLVFLGSSNRD